MDVSVRFERDDGTEPGSEEGPEASGAEAQLFNVKVPAFCTKK